MHVHTTEKNIKFLLVRSLKNGNGQNFSQKASCDIKISSGDVQEHFQSHHSPQFTMEHLL